MPGGRPPLLTPELRARFIEVVAAGNFRQVAADYVGIPRRTLYEWLSRGKAQPDGIYGEFLQATLKAERAAEIRCVGLILKAAAEDPKNAQWYLERKFPDRWGKKDWQERLESRVRLLEQQANEHAGEAKPIPPH